MQQLEFELAGYNPKIKIDHKIVVFDNQAPEEQEEEIAKDEEVLKAIDNYLSGKGLYPTHLNELVRCSMQFYLRHIVGVQEKDEVEEELGMDKIGTWLHAALERLDKEFFLKNTDPPEPQIRHILRDEFENRFKGYVMDQGLNRIYFQVGEQQVMTFLRHQMKQQPRP